MAFCITKGRPFLSKISSLKNLFLQEFHSTPTRRHAGINKNITPLSSKHLWGRMEGEVEDFVTSCNTCQQSKYITRAPLGLLQSIPPPTTV